MSDDKQSDRDDKFTYKQGDLELVYEPTTGPKVGDTIVDLSQPGEGAGEESEEAEESEESE
jgi:hypothetical protein